jgi:hypothetical protein
VIIKFRAIIKLTPSYIFKDDDDDDEKQPRYNLDNSDYSVDEEDNDTAKLGGKQVVDGKIKPRPFSSIVPSTTRVFEPKKPELDIGYNHQKTVLLTHDLEKKKAKLKIDQLRERIGSAINANQKFDDSEFIEKKKSMSVYSNGSILPRRPFSAVLDRNPIRQIQRSQFDEVEEVKKRLAQYKSNIPIDVLTKALVIPEVSNHEVKDIPLPFSNIMLQNPDLDKKKKTKKGGKKRKKR